MTQGLLWIVLTGLLWSAVGVVYSAAGKRNSNLFSFLFCGNVCFALWCWISATPLPAPIRDVALIALIMIPSGLAGQLAFLLLLRAMQSGSNGTSWSIMQSAMVVPFAAGCLWDGQSAGFRGYLGMALILAGVTVMGIVQGGGKALRRALFLTLGAFALTGIQQTLTLIPSLLDVAEEALSWRLPLASLCGMVFILPILTGKEKFSFSVWKLALLYGVVVAFGQLTVYRAIDVLSAGGRSALVYPLSVGGSIVWFLIYCALARKEKHTPAEYAGAAGILGGMTLLAMV